MLVKFLEDIWNSLPPRLWLLILAGLIWVNGWFASNAAQAWWIVTRRPTYLAAETDRIVKSEDAIRLLRTDVDALKVDRVDVGVINGKLTVLLTLAQRQDTKGH